MTQDEIDGIEARLNALDGGNLIKPRIAALYHLWGSAALLARTDPEWLDALQRAVAWGERCARDGV